MATLTKNSAISATGFSYRGSIVDFPFTGSAVIRSILADCDGSLILFWERGVLISQFWSTTRQLQLLSDPAKLVYNADKSTVVEDKSPIAIKIGKYYARYFPGSSAYYAHAAIRSRCGCGWCSSPCDRIWSVVSGSSVQSIHETEGTIPEYDEWIPMAYYLGVYGTAYADAEKAGSIAPGTNNSALFTSTRRSNELATAVSVSKQAGTVISGGGGGTSPQTSGFLPLEVVDTGGVGVDFLDLNLVDFCAGTQCKPDKPTQKEEQPKSEDCGCS